MNVARLHTLAWILVVFGALNWGLVGVFKLDLIGEIFGPLSIISRIIFVLIGLSGAYWIIGLRQKK